MCYYSSSSNMFLKKLFTNLCPFPRSSSASSSTSTFTTNKPRPASSFNTHLSRHFSIQQTKPDEDTTIDPSTSKSTTTPDEDQDIFFTSSDPDFATVIASQRFFFSSPGHSKSIVHQQQQPTSDDTWGVPVSKYSPDPYWDFRKSMQEMLEARSRQSSTLKDVHDDPNENCEYLHQLLTCYLSLNPINVHACIIKAFSDLLVNFLLDKPEDKGRSLSGSRQTLL